MSGAFTDRAGPPLHCERHYVIGDTSSAGVSGTTQVRVWTEQHKLRIFPMIERWHRLGPRSAFELLDELIGTDRFLPDDAEGLLRKYAQLDPEIVAVLGGRELQLPLVIIEGCQP